MKLVIERIVDRGVPNKERLWLRVVEAANLSFYCVLSTQGVSDKVVPGALDAYWFPHVGDLKPGDTVSLYTGPGTQTFLSRGLNTDYFFYWGKNVTLWGDPNARAVLFELASWNSTEFPAGSPMATQPVTGK